MATKPLACLRCHRKVNRKGDSEGDKITMKGYEPIVCNQCMGVMSDENHRL